jgi:hypothetical protein
MFGLLSHIIDFFAALLKRSMKPLPDWLRIKGLTEFLMLSTP